MKKKSFLFVLTLLLFFPSHPGLAREVGVDTLELNLQRAIEIALSDNPLVKIADREVERVDYSRKEAISALFPSITAEGTYSRNFTNPVIFMPDGIFGPGTGGPIEIGHDNSLNATFMATVPVFSLSILQNIKISGHDLQIALESARASRINMVAEVRKAYYSLLLANDAYRVIRQSVDNATVNFENVKRLFSQGLVSEFDVIRAEVQVRNLAPSLVQARNGVDLSELLVRVLLGLSKDVRIVVTDNLETHGESTQAINSIGTLDISGNSNLRQLDLQIGQMHDRFKLVRSQRYPTLAAFTQYQFQAQENHFRFADYRWAEPFIGGLSLQVPIFRGFAIRHQERQIQIGLEQMTWQRENLDRNLAMQVRNVYTNMERALEQVESNQVAVDLATRGFEIAKTRYSSGTGTLLELNDAEIELTRAKLNVNQALFEFLSARVEIYQLTGTDPAVGL